ncbi:MAG TPA: metalloregulator ArsR/SmtB family transcription factor [Stellaceae bacterium]|nr:metalloregulator ArsR/SmtB family transcription factor [Stellaceae bacterium]
MTAAPRRNEPLRPIGTAGRLDALDDVFGALSDPIRRAIVAQLTHGPCSVTQLGAPFAVSAPAISKHLAVLERCGLITRWKVGRVHYCRLLAESLAQAGAWIDQHQAFWAGQLDALADYLDKEGDPCGPAPEPKPRP